MKRFSFLISAVLSGSLLLAGCGGNAAGSSSGPAQGTDTVVVAMDPNSEPASGFDPAFGWGAGEHVHEPLIQSTLTVTNADLTIGYDLATGYTVSEDGLTWTVTIRDGVSFTDGEPLTAEDVAFTYNTVKNSSSVNDFTMLDYAEAADETTVVFHMTRPFSIWPYTMAIVGIVPEHAYDPAAYGSNPIGSGRYTLVQWDRGQQVILEANPDYYGDAPKMRRVVVLFMEEDAAFLKDVDLATLCIVSKMEVLTGDGEGETAEDCLVPATIAVTLSDAPKCVRCWNHNGHVGEDHDHAELCPRCAAVVRAL